MITSHDGLEYVSDRSYSTVFVVREFECVEYDALHSAGALLLGQPALLSMAATEPPRLVHHSRPVYCHLMRTNVIVFTGFRRKQEVVSASFCDYKYESTRIKFSLMFTES